MTLETPTRGEFLSPRIFGLEHEFGVHVVFETPPPDSLLREQLTRDLFLPLGSKRRYFRNGSEIYLDMDRHPEHAGPECRSLGEIVAQDKAGERMVDDLGRQLEARLARTSPAEVLLLKNNTDSDGHTYGGHENYLAWREFSLPELATGLGPFLLTRQLLVGAGKVLTRRSGETVYAFSQRAEFIESGRPGATTHQRSAVSDRDEPHADSSRYRRLHIIVGDSNMSETTNMLKVGSTDLILRMIEAGGILDDLRLPDSNDLYQAMMRDVSLNRAGGGLVWLADGRSITARDLQIEYLMRGTAFAEERGFAQEPEPAGVLSLWARVLRALETDNMSLIDRHIDWAIKLRMLQNYCDRHSISLADPRCASIDLRYHDIRPGRGLYYLAAARGAVERYVDDAAIVRAVDVPPQTRAAVRGRFVKWAEETGTDVTVSWARLTLAAARPAATKSSEGDVPLAASDPAERQIQEFALLDPFATTHSEIDPITTAASALPASAGPASVAATPAATIPGPVPMSGRTRAAKHPTRAQ